MPLAAVGEEENERHDRDHPDDDQRERSDDDHEDGDERNEGLRRRGHPACLARPVPGQLPPVREVEEEQQERDEEGQEPVDHVERDEQAFDHRDRKSEPDAVLPETMAQPYHAGIVSHVRPWTSIARRAATASSRRRKRPYTAGPAPVTSARNAPR